MTASSLAVALELEVIDRDERLPSAPGRLRRDLDILPVNARTVLLFGVLPPVCELCNSNSCGVTW